MVKAEIREGVPVSRRQPGLDLAATVTRPPGRGAARPAGHARRPGPLAGRGRPDGDAAEATDGNLVQARSLREALYRLALSRAGRRPARRRPRTAERLRRPARRAAATGRRRPRPPVRRCPGPAGRAGARGRVAAGRRLLSPHPPVRRPALRGAVRRHLAQGRAPLVLDERVREQGQGGGVAGAGKGRLARDAPSVTMRIRIAPPPPLRG